MEGFKTAKKGTNVAAQATGLSVGTVVWLILFIYVGIFYYWLSADKFSSYVSTKIFVLQKVVCMLTACASITSVSSLFRHLLLLNYGILLGFCHSTLTIASVVHLVQPQAVGSLLQRASTYVYNTMSLIQHIVWVHLPCAASHVLSYLECLYIIAVYCILIVSEWMSS